MDRASPTPLAPHEHDTPAPMALVRVDGHLLQANRALNDLLRSASNPEAVAAGDAPACPSDGDPRWLSLWAPSAAARLRAALADRRTEIEPIQSVALRTGATPPTVRDTRWFSVWLDWQGDSMHCRLTLCDVTLLKRAEREAHLRADSLDAVLDSTELMLARHDAVDLRCTLANRSYARAMGQRPDAIVGMTLPDLVGPDVMRELQPLLAQVLQSGLRSRHEMPMRLPGLVDRGWPWFEIVLTPERDSAGWVQGLFVRLADVTHRHETERALLESEDRLARFVHASVEGLVFHRDGHIVDANPAACELLGHSVHELMGRPVLEAFAPEQHEQITGFWRTRGEGRLETSVLHRSGERLPVDLIERSLHDDEPGLQMMALRDIRDRWVTQAHMHYLTHHDALTGLSNRQAFIAQLEHLMVAGRASGTQLALLFLDLDHFKRVNDSLGHAVGDVLLKTIARRMHEQIRSTDRLARFGADEFMVLLPGVREAVNITQVANKLLAAVSAPLDVEGQPISVTPSIGIAVFPHDGSDPESLIKHADAAMHAAKARGRATLAYFNQSMVDSAYADLVLEGELGHAIEHSEFALHFQPQISTHDGQLVGVEALIRWQHPQRGLLKPDEFIGLAEQHRLILPISAWVLREAARCARQWHAQGMPLTVAVNLSGIQFDAPGFLASIETLLAETGLPPGWLELELTERMLMDDVPTARERLNRLRALGVKLSVDDFGTGYSSLAHLRHLPIDKMKVDRSFVQDLPDDREAVAIATAIISLARGLGLTVVAEGVETDGQRDFLVAQGCHQLQGMGISAPLSAEALQAWAQQRRH